MRFFLILIFFLLPYVVFSSELITGENRPFISADKILFKEDFSNCAIGEPPLNFYKVSGLGECVKYKNQIWVAPASDDDYKLYKKINLGNNNFSIEFDFLGYQNSGMADFIIRLLKSKDDYWDKESVNQDLEIYDANNAYNFRLEGIGDIEKFDNFHKKKIHVAIQVKNKKLTIYANNKRLIIVPFHIEPGEHISGVEFMFVRATNKYGALLGNIKIGKYTNLETKKVYKKTKIEIHKSDNNIKIIIPKKVLFDPQKPFLRNKTEKILHIVGENLKKILKNTLIIKYPYNKANEILSLQRAQSILDYFIYVEKIDKNRIKIETKESKNSSDKFELVIVNKEE